jgi:hypothetical protein
MTFNGTNKNNDQSGWMPFQIHGELCHFQGPLTPEEGAMGVYSQTYFYDSDYASDIRSRQNSNLDKDIFDKLTLLLLNCNPHVTLYRSAYAMLKRLESTGDGDTHVAISPNIDIRLVQGKDRRAENLPTSNEVAAIIPDLSTENNIRDIRIYLKQQPGRFTRISQNHALYMPLHYVLMFPKGDLGWNWELRLSNDPTKRLEQRQYYRFRLHLRDSEFPMIFLSLRLFQQYVVDAWAVCEQNKLDWIKTHQTNIRVDLYVGLADAVLSKDSDLGSVGTLCVLPSSQLGSPQFMANQYQDAMAIFRFLGKPSLFITFTLRRDNC